MSDSAREMLRDACWTFRQRLGGAPRLLGALAILGLLLAAVEPASALETSASAILADRDRFDGQTVTIRGTITTLRETVSRRGNPYYTFDLSDGK